MPAGRPTEYTKEKAEYICLRIATSTDSLEKICEPNWLPAHTSIYAWIYKNPEFAQAYDQARITQTELLVEECVKLADSAVATMEQIQKAKLQIETRKWCASKLKPKKYGDSMMLKGDKENPLDIGLAALLDAAAEKRRQLKAERESADQLPAPRPVIDAEVIEAEPVKPEQMPDFTCKFL